MIAESCLLGADSLSRTAVRWTPKGKRTRGRPKITGEGQSGERPFKRSKAFL